MEAKVDIRKLQILNDRINQTIDALSQVRLSVHGLGHTPYMTPFNAIPPGLGIPQSPIFPGIPTAPIFPSIPQVPSYGMVPPIPGPIGLSHTPYNPIVNPLLPTPFTTPFVNPAIPPVPPVGVTPNWIPTPWTTGLFHTPIDPIELKLIEMKALDPMRIRETFPFVGF